MSALGFAFDVPFIIISFILIVKYRAGLANLFQRMSFKTFTIFALSSIPFSLVEENINCMQSGCLIFPPTIPILLIFVIILGLIVKAAKPKSILMPTIAFSLFGAIFEFGIGGANVALLALPPVFMVFMFIYVGISYAYLVIIPLTILLRGMRNKSSVRSK